MLKRLIALGAILLPWLALADVATAAPVLVAPGKLTYGVAASFTPFEYQANGADTGFDIEFGAAIAKKMGLVPTPLNIDFGGLIPALLGHRIDIINSAMYIKPARAAVVDFIPYMRIGEEIVVKTGNPLGVQSRIDLCGHRVAVTLGAIEATYAGQDNAACKAASHRSPCSCCLRARTACWRCARAAPMRCMTRHRVRPRSSPMCRAPSRSPANPSTMTR
jgi:polar amino acid transport system substrate-binding protein